MKHVRHSLSSLGFCLAVIASLAGDASLYPQSAKAATLVEELLKVARTAPAGAIPFDDSFELYITYDKDQMPLTSSAGVSPNLARPYTFTGYKIHSARGTYTNSDGETYDIITHAPTPAGSGQFNPSAPGTPSGINNLIDDTTPGGEFPTTSALYRSYWSLGSISDPSNKYPDDLTSHNVTDNLYNPAGGFAAGDLPIGRNNGVLSFGGLQFFVDYGINYAAEQYPNRYMPYQFFFQDLSQNDPNGFDYAGCPGDCGKASINVPGPLPLLGVGAAFGYTRKLRKRIKVRKTTQVMSAIG